MKEKELLKATMLVITLTLLIISQIVIFHIAMNQRKVIERLKDDLEFVSFKQNVNVKEINALKEIDESLEVN